jgi:ubiquinone/menaquinone biosynthesis C-methylase UbiE
MAAGSSIERNREAWSEWASDYVESGRRAWDQDEITWGIWRVPESELQALPDVDGKDVVELGCGTAYVSAWLARRGARVVGVDPTPAQLATARRLQETHELEFRLVEAPAERVPLPDESFDLAVSEYGASIWADPYEWIPEAARLLRPGGELVFLVNGLIAVLCFQETEIPPTNELRRPYFGLHRLEWPDDPGDDSVNFALGYGDWIRLLRTNGFDVVDLIEVRAPLDGTEHRYAALPDREWSRQWPSEEIWRARKRA